jgi:Cytochrome c554 and c-prime
VVAGAMFAVGAVAAQLYGAYGFHPQRNASAWAQLAPQFASASGCAGCHAPELASWTVSPHSTVACESCHGPLADHVATVSLTRAPASTPAPIANPDGLCITCHQAAVGRPSGFPVVDPAKHYTGATCVACHDPHAPAAQRPPTVLHPLGGLPDCLVCHGPDGMRPLPARHPATTGGTCFLCHTALQS